MREFKISYCGLRNKNIGGCKGFKSLETEMRAMTNIPFNGLRLTRLDHEHADCVGMKDINSYWDFILNHFHVKYLEMDADFTGSTSNCPAVHLAKEILGKKANSLVHVSLVASKSRFRIDLGGRTSIPQLKLIKLSHPWTLSWADSIGGILELIEASPNIEELITSPPFTLSKFSRVQPEKLQIAKSLLFYTWKSEEEELYRSFVLSQQPKLRSPGT